MVALGLHRSVTHVYASHIFCRQSSGQEYTGFFSFTDPTSCSMMREKRERLISEQTRTHGAIGMQSRFNWAVIGGIGGRPTLLMGLFPMSSTTAASCAAMCSHVQPFRASEDLSSDRLLLGQAAGATATKGA